MHCHVFSVFAFIDMSVLYLTCIDMYLDVFDIYSPVFTYLWHIFSYIQLYFTFTDIYSHVFNFIWHILSCINMNFTCIWHPFDMYSFVFDIDCHAFTCICMHWHVANSTMYTRRRSAFAVRFAANQLPYWVQDCSHHVQSIIIWSMSLSC